MNWGNRIVTWQVDLRFPSDWYYALAVCKVAVVR